MNSRLRSFDSKSKPHKGDSGGVNTPNDKDGGDVFDRDSCNSRSPHMGPAVAIRRGHHNVGNVNDNGDHNDDSCSTDVIGRNTRNHKVTTRQTRKVREALSVIRDDDDDDKDDDGDDDNDDDDDDDEKAPRRQPALTERMAKPPRSSTQSLTSVPAASATSPTNTTKLMRAPGAPKRTRTPFILFSAWKHRQIREELSVAGEENEKVSRSRPHKVNDGDETDGDEKI